MKEKKFEEVKREVVTAIICDRCKKRYDNDMDLQEFLYIGFTGGYTSVFGDMTRVEADICQDCLKELIGDFCRYDSADW